MDETMIPYRGRNNPHFMFIKRKPNQYGMKMETIADEDIFYVKLNLYRRTISDIPKPIMQKTAKVVVSRESLGTVESKTVPETVADLCSGISGDHTIVADSWYGGLSTGSVLSHLGLEYILECRGDRPSLLWSDMSKFTPDSRIC